MDAKLALQYIEIDVDRCSLTYGVAPCTAALGVTGDIKCFNSKKTCQDTANFTNVPVTLRFAVSTKDLPPEIECVASIKSISFDPATLSLGENLGQRATITVAFTDHHDSDTGAAGDPYLADRDYNPFEQGTYWGKFRARHPYVRGRDLRWITGFVPESFATSYPDGSPLPDDILDDQATRHFIIDSFTGPTPKAEFTIVGKDVLKLADGDRALAPRPSNGFLAADITSVCGATTSLSPAGIGDLEYPASGYVAIGGKEIVGFTRVADVLTMTRGQLGTVAVTHSAQDRVQLVLRYEAADPADIIADLFENYAGIPSAYIPLAEWQEETDEFLGSLYTGTIANPTPVNTLVSELIQQAALAGWWRDDAQTIGLQVLRGIDTSAAVFNEDNVVAGSLGIQEQPDKRVSKILVYFAQINPLTSLTDTANYRSLATLTDAESELDYGSAAIKQIFSRWIHAGGRAVADRLIALIEARFRDPPRKVNFSVLRDSNPVAPEMARGFRLEGWPIQDATGAASDMAIEVTRVNPGPAVVTVEAEEMLYIAPAEDLGVRNIVFDFDINNVNLRTAHDLIFLPPESGDVVVCTILLGVTVGSSSTALRAFDVGSWPAGVDITLDIRGTIEGAGGDGGRGAYSPAAASPTGLSPLPGGDGGIALYTRQAISLKVAAGTIGAGGGGGGGGAVFASYIYAYYGGHGGGGAGRVGGVGHSGGGAAPAFNGTDAFGGTGTGGVGAIAAGGGTGGHLGFAGQAGGNAAANPGGAGGAVGTAIDGVSFVTVLTGPGTILGPTIN